VLIDGLPLDAPAAPLSDLLRVGLDAGPGEPALVSALRSMTWADESQVRIVLGLAVDDPARIFSAATSWVRYVGGWGAAQSIL
jgi:hypothetical protein